MKNTVSFVAVLICVFAGSTSHAQTPANPNQPLEDEKAKLSLQKDIEDLKKQINQDQIDITKAKIGTFSTTGLPTGQAQLTSVEIQPTIIGYAALRTTMNKVLEDLYGAPCPDNTTILFKAASLDDLALLKTYKKLIDSATTQINKLNAPPAGPGAGVAPSEVFAAIDAAVALASLFKVDTAIQGVAIGNDDEAARYIFSQVVKSKCTNSIIIDPNEFSGPLLDDSDLLNKLSSLNNATDTLNATVSMLQTTEQPKNEQLLASLQKQQTSRDDIQANIRKTEVLAAGTTGADAKKLQSQLTELKAELKAIPAEIDDKVLTATSKLNALKLKIASMNAAATRVGTLNTSLNKIDDSGIPFLTRLLRAEALDSQASKHDVLILRMVKIGGNNITKKNAFWTSIKFGGGALVKFELRSSDLLTIKKAGEEDAYQYHSEGDKLGSAKEQP